MFICLVFRFLIEIMITFFFKNSICVGKSERLNELLTQLNSIEHSWIYCIELNHNLGNLTPGNKLKKHNNFVYPVVQSSGLG